MSKLLSRRQYVELYGPTTGDQVRLGDTELWAEVERDLLVPGDELVFGAGKTLRVGTGCHGRITAADGALDLVITNAMIIDPVIGIVKADIGIKDGKIAGIGKAGDPRIMDGVHPSLVVGTNTDVRAAEGLIVTAGGIDCHVHFIDPGQCEEALSSGVTTLFGGGLGATTVPIASTGTVNLAHMLQASDAFPLNFGFLGKAASDSPDPIIEQLRSGAAGMKIHEDWGATTATINSALSAAEEADVQIQIHTDTLNEFGFLERTLKAIDGRVIHAYHVEGAGGGHAPDIIKVCGLENILPSSTNPTNPYTVNTFDEHFDMAMVSHHLNPRLPEDIAFAESRVRHETIAAEGVLHDIGAISAIGSDSQGMGRIGETIARTWQNASRMKMQRGALPEDLGSGNDNTRIKRFIAKYTINPARIFGVDKHVGSLETGKLADLVLWKPGMFGIKPEAVFKSGFPVMAAMGEANASLYLCEPIRYRRQWGWFGQAAQSLSVCFTSQLAIDRDIAGRLELRSRCIPVTGAQKLSKRDMLWNDAVPNISVNPDTYEVSIDGEICTSLPASKVSLGPLYTLK